MAASIKHMRLKDKHCTWLHKTESNQDSREMKAIDFKANTVKEFASMFFVRITTCMRHTALIYWESRRVAWRCTLCSLIVIYIHMGIYVQEISSVLYENVLRTKGRWILKHEAVRLRYL